MFNLLNLLTKSPTKKQEFLYNLDRKDWKLLSAWVQDYIIKDRTMYLEDWLTTSFYLMKERWDASMDWLEKQPSSKIMHMIEISRKHAERLNNAQNKK